MRAALGPFDLERRSSGSCLGINGDLPTWGRGTDRDPRSIRRRGRRSALDCDNSPTKPYVFGRWLVHRRKCLGVERRKPEARGGKRVDESPIEHKTPLRSADRGGIETAPCARSAARALQRTIRRSPLKRRKSFRQPRNLSKRVRQRNASVSCGKRGRQRGSGQAHPLVGVWATPAPCSRKHKASGRLLCFSREGRSLEYPHRRLKPRQNMARMR